MTKYNTVKYFIPLFPYTFSYQSIFCCCCFFFIFDISKPEEYHDLLFLLFTFFLQNPKKASVTRRFLVIEGISVNYGDIAPLPKIVSNMVVNDCNTLSSM